MGIVTKTFTTEFDPTTTTSMVTPLITIPPEQFTVDDEIGIYLESFMVNIDCPGFRIAVIPDIDGDESEGELASKLRSALVKSEKIGLLIYTKKTAETTWKEIADFTIVNRGGKDYFDILVPYLAKVAVRLLEKDDQIGVQLRDLGHGFLKVGDKITVSAAIRIEVKKNDDLEALKAQVEALELALYGRLTNLPANSLLGRGSTIGAAEIIPQSTFAKPADVDSAILNLIGAAPTQLNTLDELAQALADDANFASSVTAALATKAPLANPSFTGFVALGDNIAIKLRVITGTTSATQGGVANVLMGLDSSKVLSFFCVVHFDENGRMPMNISSTGLTGYQFECYVDNDLLAVRLSATNSANILNKPFSASIIYKA